jgi:cell division transport system ATP-binding protein
MGRRLLRLFIELNRLGTSVIIATHDYQLMSQFPAPRLQLENGRLEIQD